MYRYFSFPSFLGELIIHQALCSLCCHLVMRKLSIGPIGKNHQAFLCRSGESITSFFRWREFAFCGRFRNRKTMWRAGWCIAIWGDFFVKVLFKSKCKLWYENVINVCEGGLQTKMKFLEKNYLFQILPVFLLSCKFPSYCSHLHWKSKFSHSHWLRCQVPLINHFVVYTILSIFIEVTTFQIPPPGVTL